MRKNGIALLAMTVIVAGCGSGSPARPAEAVTGSTSTFSTEIATPYPSGLYSATDSASPMPSAVPGYYSSPAPSGSPSDYASPEPSASPTDYAAPYPTASSYPVYGTPMPTVAPSYEPLPLGTLPPWEPTPAPSQSPAQSLPQGVSDQTVKQWTDGWAIFGTKRAHVDLLVNYFPDSFFAPPANVTIEISWTNGGAVVDTVDYGPWQLTAPNSEEATFDAPVESDGEQIQILPAS